MDEGSGIVDVSCYCILTKVQKDVGYLESNGGNLETWTMRTVNGH